MRVKQNREAMLRGKQSAINVGIIRAVQNCDRALAVLALKRWSCLMMATSLIYVIQTRGAIIHHQASDRNVANSDIIRARYAVDHVLQSYFS
jgi:hypothetical protein